MESRRFTGTANHSNLWLGFWQIGSLVSMLFAVDAFVCAQHHPVKRTRSSVVRFQKILICNMSSLSLEQSLTAAVPTPRVNLDINGYGSQEAVWVRIGGGPCEVNKRRLVAATLSLQPFGCLKCSGTSYLIPSIKKDPISMQNYLVPGVMDGP